MSPTRYNPAFPFARSGPDSDFIHRKVVEKINDQSFHFQLPELSEVVWTTVCNNNQERERLEFVGDALMSGAVAEELYRLYGDVSPGFYTKTRSILTANSTFAHLMHKAGFHNMSDPVKPAGDAFETIIAAYHKERGREAFCQWIQQYFLPLIQVAGAAYNVYQTDAAHRRKQKRNHVHGLERQLLAKARPRSSHRRTKRLSALKGLPVRQKPSSSLSPVATPRPSQSHSSNVLEVTIIDLTDDSEWEDVDNHEGVIEEISPGSFYGTRYTHTTPVVKGSDLLGSTQELLRTIKRGSPGIASYSTQIEPAPSTPTPAMKRRGKSVREYVDTDDELASYLQRTPMLGSVTNPITID